MHHCYQTATWNLKFQLSSTRQTVLGTGYNEETYWGEEKRREGKGDIGVITISLINIKDFRYYH